MVLALTLAGFTLASLVEVNLALVGLVGAIVMAVRPLRQRRTTPRAIIRSAKLPFLAFVLALGVVVRAVVDHGLGDAVGRLVPSGVTLPALLALAAIGAVLANLINNLPAALVLLALVAPSGTGAVLAVLIGVNIGPNLTYAGSLATLLWRRIVREHDRAPKLGEFTLLGAMAVPASLAAAVVALWAGLQLIGP